MRSAGGRQINTIPEASSARRGLGFWAACFILIGYVVGASIFVLPGELAGIAGPAVFLSYGIAAVPAVLYSLVVVQVGIAYPETGGAMVLVRDGLSSACGFAYLWLMLSMALVAIPLIALGFAHYAGLLFPEVPEYGLAIACIVFFTATNSLGVSVTGVAQSALVFFFVLMLLVFTGVGVTSGTTDLLTPLLPHGVGGVFTAAATAYFSYGGVLVIAEIAGEIRDPQRNIPRVIGVGMVVVILLYGLVSLALAMSVPWSDLASEPIPVLSAARQHLSPALVQAVLFAVLAAAATSVNSIVLGLSRDLAAGAALGELPHVLSHMSRNGVPVYAVCVLGMVASLVSGLGATLGVGIGEFANTAVVAMLIVQMLSSLALWRMARRQPDRFGGMGFRLPTAALRLVCFGTIVLSLMLLVLMLSANPMVLFWVLTYMVIGFLCRGFWMRR